MMHHGSFAENVHALITNIKLYITIILSLTLLHIVIYCISKGKSSSRPVFTTKIPLKSHVVQAYLHRPKLVNNLLWTHNGV